jgi:hypothetical protein
MNLVLQANLEDEIWRSRNKTRISLDLPSSVSIISYLWQKLAASVEEFVAVHKMFVDTQ